MKVLGSSNYKTTQWSGGTTTELYIYPETADFKKGNYYFRLSTATIEVEKSTFTSLPDVDRTFLLLEGEITLTHEGHHSKRITPLEQDQFKGDWQTKSIGRGKPLNLMTKNCEGKISVHQEDVMLNNTGKHLCIYCAEGSLIVNGVTLNQNELMVIEENLKVEMKVQGTAVGVVVDKG